MVRGTRMKAPYQSQIWRKDIQLLLGECKKELIGSPNSMRGRLPRSVCDKKKALARGKGFFMRNGS